MTVNELIAALQALVAENPKASDLPVATYDNEYGMFEEIEEVKGWPLAKSDDFKGRAGFFRYGSGDPDDAKPKVVVDLRVR